MKRRKQRRPRGSCYQHGKTWWVRFADRSGNRVRINTRLDVADPANEESAAAFLKQRLAETDLQRGPVIAGRVTFERLAQLLRNHSVNEGNRSLDRAEYSIARLAERFAGAKGEEITAAALDEYVAKRIRPEKEGGDGVSRGTVRLELAALRLMLRLAVEKKMLAAGDVPSFPSLKPGAARKGFFEAEDFERVVAHLPDYLRPVALFGFYAGWRKGEILGLQWKQVDLQAKVVRLEADQSKNDEARTLAYGQHSGLVDVLKGQDEARKALLRETGKLCPWVFHHGGRPIVDFYHAWREATRKANVPGRLFHDLRRSCVRNMERAGVSRSVATKITGHKTETIYRRYAIVSEADVAAGLGKVSALHLGHNSATNGDSEARERTSGGS